MARHSRGQTFGKGLGRCKSATRSSVPWGAGLRAALFRGLKDPSFDMHIQETDRNGTVLGSSFGGGFGGFMFRDSDLTEYKLCMNDCSVNPVFADYQ